MIDGIVEFIRARLDEDEQEAHAAFSGQMDPENGWGSDGRAVTPHVGVIHEDVQRAHVIKWNPARVLSGVAAKRRVVDAYVERSTSMPDWGGAEHDDYPGGERDGLSFAVRAVASEWSGHPNFRREWAP